MLPSILLIIDIETTGLDIDRDSAIELGAILYSVHHRCILQQLSTLLPVSGENSVEHINGISGQASRSSYEYQSVIELFQQWHERTDYLVAHNAEFDKKWFGSGLLPAVSKPWLCTYKDFLWMRARRQRLSLVKLALKYDIKVEQVHRSLSDCQIIAALFNKAIDFQEMLVRAIEKSQKP
jgi:DNA polymerase III subunit epsilon